MSDWARLYKLQRQMGLGLPYHLRNTMDKDQQADTDKLKERAVAPCVADFIQTLAEWGFNNVEHTMLWEAMCPVIEAGERGELDDVINAIEGDDDNV